MTDGELTAIKQRMEVALPAADNLATARLTSDCSANDIAIVCNFVLDDVPKLLEELKKLQDVLVSFMSSTIQMTTPLGLLSVNSTGMRTLVDEVARLQSELTSEHAGLLELQKSYARVVAKLKALARS